ncbi:MAG: hypothetical protein U0R80_09765 [Nocardioidaceae bacterium]
MIIVAGPFMLILIGMCFSLLKAPREEPTESLMPSRVRRAVQHAEAYPEGPGPQRGEQTPDQSMTSAT